MKTLYATLFICLMLPFCALVTSAKLVQLAPEQTAKVGPVQGVFIFYLCTPAQPFDVLGEIKVKQQWSGEPKEQVKTAIKSALEQYPNANGILFTDLNMTKAQAIKLQAATEPTK